RAPTGIPRQCLKRRGPHRTVPTSATSKSASEAALAGAWRWYRTDGSTPSHHGRRGDWLVEDVLEHGAVDAADLGHRVGRQQQVDLGLLVAAAVQPHPRLRPVDGR